VTPFDVYRGDQVGPGHKSVALRVGLRSQDRTLTGDDADACMSRVVAALAHATGGRLRC
jgi:phenylalanyl-tRNA synthetase beta chain